MFGNKSSEAYIENLENQLKVKNNELTFKDIEIVKLRGLLANAEYKLSHPDTYVFTYDNSVKFDELKAEVEKLMTEISELKNGNRHKAIMIANGDIDHAKQIETYLNGE